MIHTILGMFHLFIYLVMFSVNNSGTPILLGFKNTSLIRMLRIKSKTKVIFRFVSALKLAWRQIKYVICDDRQSIYIKVHVQLSR